MEKDNITNPHQQVKLAAHENDDLMQSGFDNPTGYSLPAPEFSLNASEEETCAEEDYDKILSQSDLSSDNASTGAEEEDTSKKGNSDSKKTSSPKPDKKELVKPTTTKSKKKPDSSLEKIDASKQSKRSKSDKTLRLTAGIMMLATEGQFDGGANEVRKPHFPENLAFYRKVTETDKAAWKKKGKSPRRYNVDSNLSDRVKISKSGEYVKAKSLSRFKASDYDRTPPTGQIIATGPYNSGLTIGMGFDLGAKFKVGEQDKAKKQLMAAGIEEATAIKLSKAAGLKSRKAGKMAAQLRAAGVKITAQQTLDLLINTRKSYVKNFEPGVVHESIEEVMVKLNYWLGNRGASKIVKQIFEAAKAKQGTAQIDAAIAILKTKKHKTYQVSVRFLKLIKAHIEKGGDVTFEKKAPTLEELTNGENDTLKTVKSATAIGKSKGKDLQKQLTGSAAKDSSSEKSGGVGEKPASWLTSMWKTGATSAKVPKADPATAINKKQSDYQAGKITLEEFGKSMKPYCGGASGLLVMSAMKNLYSHQQDTFAYALVSNSSDSELLKFNEFLLGDLSKALHSWFFDSEKEQQARVDKASGKIAVANVKRSIEEQEARRWRNTQAARQQTSKSLSLGGTVAEQNSKNSNLFSVSKDGKTLASAVDIEAARAWMIGSSKDNKWDRGVHYNYNTAIRIGKYVSEHVSGVNFNTPTNLEGNAKDDHKIVTGNVIMGVALLQARKGLTVTGIPNGSFIKNVMGEFSKQKDKTAELNFMNKETSNTSMADEDGKTIAIPNFQSADEATLYDFFRDITLARNGLWSDESQITNIVSLRRELDSASSTDWNDTLAVAWTEGTGANAVKHCNTYIGSTEAGNNKKNRHIQPQTALTLLGEHVGRQSGGRNSHLLVQGANKGDLSFDANDGNGFNFHPGGMSGSRGGIGVTNYALSSVPGAGGAMNDYEFKVQHLLSEIFYVLGNWGKDRKKSAYTYLSEANKACLLYTSPSPRDLSTSRMPSSA